MTRMVYPAEHAYDQAAGIWSCGFSQIHMGIVPGYCPVCGLKTEVPKQVGSAEHHWDCEPQDCDPRCGAPAE